MVPTGAGLRDAVAGFEGESDAELAAVLRPLGWALYHLNRLGDSAREAILIGEPLITPGRSPGIAPPAVLTGGLGLRR